MLNGEGADWFLPLLVRDGHGLLSLWGCHSILGLIYLEGGLSSNYKSLLFKTGKDQQEPDKATLILGEVEARNPFVE
jgi:hypothetical protein